MSTTVMINPVLLVSCALLAASFAITGDLFQAFPLGELGGSSGRSSRTERRFYKEIKGCHQQIMGMDGLPSSVSGWMRIISFLLYVERVSGDGSAGGCVIIGSDQNDIDCNDNNNENKGSLPSSGDKVALAIGIIGALIALPTALAAIWNPKTRVDNRLIWDYRFALLYKFIEGCSCGFGCGCLGYLERCSQVILKKGGLWRWARNEP